MDHMKSERIVTFVHSPLLKSSGTRLPLEVAGEAGAEGFLAFLGYLCGRHGRAVKEDLKCA
jgi:hypothetical protein